MTKTQLLALAAFITSLANGECGEATETASAGDAPAASGKRRGRPPTTDKPESEKAADKPVEQEKGSGELPATNAKTYEELRAIIEGPVKDGKGPDVKAIIAKYATDLKTLATLPQHHAAFEKDMEALSY
jgi:hypothetical protein